MRNRLTTAAAAFASQAPFLAIVDELLFAHHWGIGIVTALPCHIALIIGQAHHQVRGFYPQAPIMFNAIL